MKRRQALRALPPTAGVALTAGCLFWQRGPSAGFDLTLSPLGDDLRTAFTLSEADLTAPQAEITSALGGNETVVGHGRRRFEDGDLVRVNGTYYRLTVEADGTETVRRPVLTARAVDERDVEGEAVPADRYDGDAYRAVNEVVVTAYRGHSAEHVFYTSAERPGQLTPEPRHTYVTVQNETFRLAVTERDVTADRFVYGWTALDDGAVEAVIRERAAVVDATSAALSSDAAAILDRARTDPPYAGTVPFSDPEREVLDLLGVERQSAGTDERNLRFGDTFYRARVEWWHSD